MKTLPPGGGNKGKNFGFTVLTMKVPSLEQDNNTEPELL
jgi:hypothetical protein